MESRESYIRVRCVMSLVAGQLVTCRFGLNCIGNFRGRALHEEWCELCSMVLFITEDACCSCLKARFNHWAASCDRHGERAPVEADAFEGEAPEPEVPEEKSIRFSILSVVFDKPILRILSFSFR